MNLRNGQKISSIRNNYTVVRMECYSDRSKTWLVQDEKNILFRLKCYDGMTTMDMQARNRLEKLPMMYSGSCVIDRGEIDGVLFDVSPLMAGDLNVRNVPIYAVRHYLLPQLSEGLHALHSQGLLLRDLCPEHILVSNDSAHFFFCGFSNMVCLSDCASKTSIPDNGVRQSFRAPECDTAGFSTASDYYSLGMLVYTLYRRLNGDSFNDMTQPDLQTIKDCDVRQLVAGLTCQEPEKRWREIQIDDWLEKRAIRKQKRVFVRSDQLASPIVFCGEKCWEYSQLAELIGLKSPTISSEQFQNLVRSLVENVDFRINRINNLDKEPISLIGKCFRLIYVLNPETQGVWVGGKKYEDTETLFKDASQDSVVRENLKLLLQEKAFTYWADAVDVTDMETKISLAELEKRYSFDQ